jgi:hypothetical protein
MVLPLTKCEENGIAIVSMYRNIAACISIYLIFYFLINIGLNSIKIKLLKLNPLIESSIDCEFKSFNIYQSTIIRTDCS